MASDDDAFDKVHGSDVLSDKACDESETLSDIDDLEVCNEVAILVAWAHFIIAPISQIFFAISQHDFCPFFGGVGGLWFVLAYTTFSI